MKIVKWDAWCPFEVGDKVRVEGDDKPHEITDIATTHYLKSGKTIFSYELDNCGYYRQIKVLDKSDIGHSDENIEKG